MSNTGSELVCPLCQANYADDEIQFCVHDGARLQPRVELNGRLRGRLLAERYEVRSFLGAGGMAEVYRAQRIDDELPVALKLMRPQVSEDPAAADRFEQEARLIGLLDHPNVVELYDSGTLEDGTLFMAMELLEGHSLEQRLAGGALPLPLTLDVAVQACDGLHAAHAAGIIHRDVKPANLFLKRVDRRERESEMVVKVLDLGIAKLTGDRSSNLTATGMIFGSPEYMSPEQAMGKPVDHRADIYSVGVVLFQAFTGDVPFSADSFVGVLTAHMTQAPVWPAQLARKLGLPSGLKGVILKALAKNPDHRQQSMTELRDALVSACTRTSWWDRRRKTGEGARITAEVRALAGESQTAAMRAADGTGEHEARERPPTTGQRSTDTGQPTVMTPPAGANGQRRLTRARPTSVQRVTLSRSGGDLDHEVVELAPDVFWVGRREGVFLERNVYLRVFRGRGLQINLLIDPGPTRDLSTVAAKAKPIIGPLGNVDIVFLNHQDPDVAGNASLVQQLNPQAHVVCSEDTWRLVQFFGLRRKSYSAVEHYRDLRMPLATGLEVQFVPSPYCHFRGAVMLYDLTSRVLFSGDLFGGVSSSLELVAGPDSLAGVEIFHQLYMPSRKALQRAVQQVRQLDPPPLAIAPQHGGIIGGDQLEQVLACVERLEVGTDFFDPGQHVQQHIDAINQIVAQLARRVGESRVSEQLRCFAKDGTFPNLFIFDGDRRVAEIKIEPRAALRALLARARELVDDDERPAFDVQIKQSLGEHGLTVPGELGSPEQPVLELEVD